MQQKVLIVTPVALYEIVNSKTIERGNCACAIVAIASDRPKYSLVCYNDRRETLCVGAISSNNEHSIQFELQVSMYASFRDNTGKRWSFMFLKNTQIESFLAVIGIAQYALAGQPSHTTIISDFAPTNGELRLGLQHRAKIRYTAFAIRKGEILQLGEVLETNGDSSYNFQPVQSNMFLSPESKGFESSVLGMLEETHRSVVVPAKLPRAGKNIYGNDDVVFVLQLVRIIHNNNDNNNSVTDNAMVPMVFTGDYNENILRSLTTATSRDSNGTQIVVLHTEGREATSNIKKNENDKFSHSYIAGTYGTGIPAEHMTLIQKLGVQVNNITTEARDVKDVVVSVAGEWKQSINRPKPSALTNAALEQAVKQLIIENEKITNDISRRDELLRALDQRNRELQKRVDSIAMISQQLMDEKNDSVRSASDVKLEKERLIMKLQEQINQTTHERDDTQRHLQTVKKLLEVSDEELRQVRGKSDIHKIQAESIISKLNSIKDALSEERSRRKGLEAKVIALQEEISNAEADLHIKTSQLEDIRRKADIERAHHAQIMEDERQRRSFEAQQLRSEIVSELQLRESKFQADRARVAEDNFKRGQTEGKEIGKREARCDVETQIEELRVETQHALTELDTSKTELRKVNEEAMAQNRMLSAKVAELKRQMYEETRKRVQIEFQLINTRTKVRCAQDNIMVAFTSAVYRLRRPIEVEDAIKLLETIKQRGKLDFSFEDRKHAEDAVESMKRRIAWIEEKMFSLYYNGLESIYQDWLQPILVEKDNTVQAVRHLWLERDGASHYELNLSETRERFEIGQQMEKFFEDLTSFFNEQMMQRETLLKEAEDTFTKLFNEYLEVIEGINTLRLKELQERKELYDEYNKIYNNIINEEEMAYRGIILENFTGIITVNQNIIMKAEESVRAAIDADQCLEFSGLLFDFEAKLTLLKQLAAIVTEQNIIILAESQSRMNIIVEEEQAVGEISEEYNSTFSKELLPEKEEEYNPINIEDKTNEFENPDTTKEKHEHNNNNDNNNNNNNNINVKSFRKEESDESEILVSSVQSTEKVIPTPKLPSLTSTTVKIEKTAVTKAKLFGSSSSSSSDDNNNNNNNKGNYTNINTMSSGKFTAATRRLPPPKSKLFDSSDSD